MAPVLNQRIKLPVLIIVPLVCTSVPLLTTVVPSVRTCVFKSILPSVIVRLVATATAFAIWIPAAELSTIIFVKFSPPGVVIVCRELPLRFTVLVASVKPPDPQLDQLPARFMVLATGDKMAVPIIFKLFNNVKLFASVLV